MPDINARPSNGGGKISRPVSSEDGRGGTSPTSESKSGARYVYYRLYTKDGPLESNKPIYSNDRFISRVSSTSVRPPHTAASLKRYICKVEGLGEFKTCALYQSLSDKTAMEESTRLPFRGTPGPGSSDLEPMAVVADTHASERRSQAAKRADSQACHERDFGQRYVYYRIYDEDGETVSKTSFGKNSPFLGRVDTLSIPPPHNPGFLKYHIINSEEILGHSIQLFEDEDTELPMDDDDSISLLADTFPGFLEDRPIAIAYESLGDIRPVDNKDPNEILARDPYKARSALEELQKSNETHAHELAQVRHELEKTKEKHARELQEEKSRLNDELKMANEAHEGELRMALLSPDQLRARLGKPSFTKKLKVVKTFTWKDVDPSWHTLKEGDMLYTDGIRRRENRQDRAVSVWDCYLAISSSGKLAFVPSAPHWTTLC